MATRRPPTASDWPFPFPVPGRPRAARPDAVPPATAYRWPFHDLDPSAFPARAVPASLSLDDFKARVREWADDVGVISIDDPAIAHERDEVLWVYPHARSLICLIGEENRAAMQSRYLPAANHELYSCEERIFEMGHRTVKLVNALGGEGLTTTIGWPQEAGQRWADKLWPLSHKLVAQAAGLGVIGLSRNFLHRRFGAYCLIDTVVTNLGPEDSPTCARKSVKPRLRRTRLAEMGIVQVRPPVRRLWPRTSATTSTPARPRASLPTPGIGKAMAPTRKPAAMPIPMEM